MKPGFEPGITHEVCFEVTEAMCPAFEGKILHRCYSTWAVVHHMEVAARAVIVDYLEDTEEAVGAHVSVDHIAPCRLGRTVRHRVTLSRISGHRVTCDVTVFDGERLLARGTHIQYVTDKRRLKRHIEGR